MKWIGLKWFAIATAIGMAFVLVGGALVTKTDSGRGCGTDWPLCHGKFIPAYTIESMIEYSHRAVSGIVGLMVLIVAIWVWRSMRSHFDAKFYAFIALLFTALQAVLGAMAVMWPQSSPVLALHFGISLIAFSGSLLLAITVRRAVLASQRLAGQPGSDANPPVVKAAAISGRFKWGAALITIYCYIVVYIGAFIRHTDSSGGCTGWPLCNGELIPELSGATGIVFMHRIAALLLLISIIVLAAIANRHYSTVFAVRRSANLILLFVVMQVLSGALVTGLISNPDWLLFASLLHTLIISGLFAALCYLCGRIFIRGKAGDLDAA